MLMSPKRSQGQNVTNGRGGRLCSLRYAPPPPPPPHRLPELRMVRLCSNYSFQVFLKINVCCHNEIVEKTRPELMVSGERWTTPPVFMTPAREWSQRRIPLFPEKLQPFPWRLSMGFLVFSGVQKRGFYPSMWSLPFMPLLRILCF